MDLSRLRKISMINFLKVLLKGGFKQSNIDTCLFMKKYIVCVIYVDDTIVAGPDPKAIEDIISSLGIPKEEQRHLFELRDEGEVGDFLGIRIEKTGSSTFTLTQSGLINKVIKTAGMEICNSAKTPYLIKALGKDETGEIFNESWEYATIVGMLIFISTNSRPYIAY